ncbi:MAG: squalene synthase HpnC [Candidatus Kapabacteria bacterium]|nr:squalene synthase HpnC [Candidatus Kapabacteria bacterium]
MKFTFEELLALTSKDGCQFRVVKETDAFNFCKSIALGHYENFPVASLLLPRQRRKYIYSVYAFARIADDIADEFDNIDKTLRLNALDRFLNLIREEGAGNPIIMAVKATMREYNIDASVFGRLISAFKSDINFQQPETLFDIYNYCNSSANPVGELILRIFAINDEESIKLSDKICTALQLANFWQDLSIDISRKRFYIPVELLKKYEIQKNSLESYDKSHNFIKLLDYLLLSTEELFKVGTQLVRKLKPFRLRLEIAATLEGGLAILNKISELGTGILSQRPALRKRDYIKIILKALKHSIL